MLSISCSVDVITTSSGHLAKAGIERDVQTCEQTNALQVPEPRQMEQENGGVFVWKRKVTLRDAV
ncbi:hypothetical protein CBOM_07656 [Ceraceosorus bombacis]|uniref:Uncharacterized protein n=1 Tax=Ceraceosorus bombacis TaxID=401625 RepID=A0A0P1B8U8_9BASI|nr:hypothetical protein CBOM_07656 [Ceraceosorus bombacis]